MYVYIYMDYANDTQWIHWVQQASIQHVIANAANAATQRHMNAMQLPSVTSHPRMAQRQQWELKVVQDLHPELKAVQDLDPCHSSIEQVSPSLPDPLAPP
jgi:hypothetical protein